MRNSILLLLAFLTIPAFIFSNTQAAEFQLHKVTPNQFEIVISKISKAVEPDDNKIEILPFDLNQTFQVSKN